MPKCLNLECQRIVSWVGKRCKKSLCSPCKISKNPCKWLCQRCGTVMIDEMILKKSCSIECYKAGIYERWKMKHAYLHYDPFIFDETKVKILEFAIIKVKPLRYYQFYTEGPLKKISFEYGMKRLLQYGLMTYELGEYHISKLGRELVHDKALYSKSMLETQ